MKKQVLVCSLILLVLVASVGMYLSKKQQRGYEVLSKKTREYIVSHMTEAEGMEFQLMFNGEALPYDQATKTYFLPLSMEEAWEGGEFSVDAENVTILFGEDFKQKDKLSLMEENATIGFLAYDGVSYSEYFLKPTGMAVVDFTGTEFMSPENLGIFEIAVYDNDTKTDWVKRCFTTSELHGNTSLAYDKKSLRLKLLEQGENGFEKCNKNLLDIRDDDDWILNSLYADDSRIRDKLAVDLWNETGAKDHAYQESYGTDGEYVEVFINDNYQGIYLLMYPIDRKQLGMDAVSDQLSRGDTVIERIYKKKYTAFWQESDFVGEMPDPNMPDFRGGFYLKGDTVLGDLTEWEPLRALAACIEAEDSVFEEEITNLVNQENTIDNWLFYQAIAGFDNYSKNMYYAVRNEGGKTMGYFVPWDLNISFGVVFAENEYYCARDAATLEQLIPWEPGNRMMELDADGSVALAKETWKKWRENAFSKENVLKKIESLEHIVKASGALKREKERWPDSNVDEDFSYLKEYTVDRLEFMDEYMDALTPTE